ncbi:MAG: T9SS type A sorting domain-containing protein [Flavobacteriales bacterium]|nr:T9SS type A sorting domain-containing protein [Flavobacteriales bacterium]
MRDNIISIVLFTLVLLCCDRLSGQCQVVQDEVDTYLYSEQDFGQSLVFCESGRLSQMDIHTHHYLTGGIAAQLRLFIGEGYQGQEIYTAEIFLEDSWASIYSHVYNDTVLVQQGTVYTLRIEYLGEIGAVWVDFADVYEEGNLILDGEAHENADMGFSAFIEPMETEDCMTWTGAVDQEWNNAENWSTQTVPDSTDCVIIEESENGQYPVILTTASTGDLVIAQGASLILLEEAELRVFGNLDSYGQSEFNGEVTLEESTSESEINGSPIFDQLTIRGVYFATEPIEIIDVLDLSEGYLVNLGTELYLNSGNGNLGHAYVPEDVVQGPVIIKKHVEHFGEQILGLPFQSMTDSMIRTENSIADILIFDHTEPFLSFSDNWTVTEEFNSSSSYDAIRTTTAEPIIYLEGQTSNEDLIVTRNTIGGEALNNLQLISNPFPSVINVEGIEWIGASCTAMYKWIPERQQFGSFISGLTTHGMGNFLLPTEAIMVEIKNDEQLYFNYDLVALEPNEMMESLDEPFDTDILIKLGVDADSGSDELLIRLDNESSELRVDDQDALKIPSLNSRVPTVGTVNIQGDILSINTMPPPIEGATIQLYIDAGLSYNVSISPLIIEIGEQYESMVLVDLKYGIYHDLISLGTYYTDTDLEDDPHRFLLRFGDIQGDDRPGLEDYEIPQNGLDDSSWSVYSVENDLIVTPPFYDYGAITYLSIYSPEGKLIYTEELDSSADEWRRTLQVESGIYLIAISDGNEWHTKKIWLD